MRNRVNICEKTFKVNKEKRTIVCMAKCNLGIYRCKDLDNLLFYDTMKKVTKGLPVSYTGEYKVVSVVKCHPDDVFDEIKGRRIAESRAKKEAYNIAYHFWNNLREYCVHLATLARNKADACDIAEMIEKNHIEELTK